MFAFIFQYTFSQNIVRCSSMDVLAADELNDPSLAADIAMNQQLQDQWIASHPNGGDRAVITVPVVVHVVYSSSNQNISDQQIQSQIDVLNQDYSRQNSDAGNTPSVFQSVAANCDIQFCLAVRDPNGNPTTGIERIQTNTTSWSTNDLVKKSANGGADGWPKADYLNIWVCNLGGGILGYSSFPSTNQSTAWKDGVVIGYKYFGNMGTVQSPYDLGRTATHECGHWFGLYHIWGDDNGACSGSDNISDTPNQGSENYGCPVFPHISCNNGPNGDMSCNYMDYTDDNCMNMFTAGQKTKMTSVLNTTRSSIKLSQGCIAVGIKDVFSDGNISLFPNPANTFMQVVINNNSLQNINIKIYNMVGELISASTINETTMLDVSSLSAGMYYITLSSEGYFASRKILIQR